MSLAIYAAPFDSDSSNNNHIDKKRISNNNKTQKRYPTNHNQKEEPITTNADKQRVMSVLHSIQNLPAASSDGDLADYHNELNMDSFQPPPPPVSAKTNTTPSKESFISQPPPSFSEIDGEDTDYYKRYIPNYNEIYRRSGYELESEYPNMNKKAPIATSSIITSSSNDTLVEKLNYMIHLLEEQQDERTNNVTEEVILYSFLGIFIIFIVDSFARVGKYTR